MVVESILERRGHLPLAFLHTDFLLSSKSTVSMAVVGRDTTGRCNRTDRNEMSWVGLRGNAVPFWALPIASHPILYHGHSSDGSSRLLQLALQMCKQVSFLWQTARCKQPQGGGGSSASWFQKVQSFLMDSAVFTTVNHKAESKQEEVKDYRLPKIHYL